LVLVFFVKHPHLPEGVLEAKPPTLAHPKLLADERRHLGASEQIFESFIGEPTSPISAEASAG
jgi:hypothetical protein